MSAPRSSGARVRWLVDGMNVIGSKPDGWWRDRRGAMRDLVARLGSFAGHGNVPVTVVLDASPFELGATAGRVEVVFAPGGPNAADDVIAGRVESDPEPTSLAVVTSDRHLAQRVAARGADVVSSGSFRRRLTDDRAESPPGGAGQRPR
jgi:predicted RNA-binding protein with PIN domain